MRQSRITSLENISNLVKSLTNHLPRYGLELILTEVESFERRQLADLRRDFGETVFGQVQNAQPGKVENKRRNFAKGVARQIQLLQENQPAQRRRKGLFI